MFNGSSELKRQKTKQNIAKLFILKNNNIHGHKTIVKFEGCPKSANFGIIKCVLVQMTVLRSSKECLRSSKKC